MKKSNDTIGNRTRDLPACSAVPQPTASPRAVWKNHQNNHERMLHNILPHYKCTPHCTIYHTRISQSLHATKTSWTGNRICSSCPEFLPQSLSPVPVHYVVSDSHTLYLHIQYSLRAQCPVSCIYHLQYRRPSHMVSHHTACCLIRAPLDVSCKWSFFRILF
jgi:hypothetical protein